MYEYQSLICELTGMDYSNASMYDGASSLAEAALLAVRAFDKKRILISETVHPEYRAVLKTYFSFIDCKIVELRAKNGVTDPEHLKQSLNGDVAAVIFQQPNFFGFLEDMKRAADLAHENGGLFIACVNPVSLGILQPPGEYGADIAVGEGQPLGNAVSFGGPHFGFFTVKEPLLRRIPGRLAGLTVDKNGKRAFVLTLQAREQHIRREKATSNICTNQALCALKGAIYLSMLGKEGVRKLSLLNMKNAHETFERLLKIKGVRRYSDQPFFNEFTLFIDRDPVQLRKKLDENGILGPLALKNFIPSMEKAYLLAVTEKRTSVDLERLCAAVETSS